MVVDQIKTKWIEAILSNDEISTDLELYQVLVEHGILKVEAEYWISQRPWYLKMALLLPIQNQRSKKSEKV